jgi:hypothetical protein
MPPTLRSVRVMNFVIAGAGESHNGQRSTSWRPKTFPQRPRCVTVDVMTACTVDVLEGVVR